MAVHAAGTVLTFTGAGHARTVVGRLSSIGEVKPVAEEIDITTLDTEGGFRRRIPGLRDVNEVELTGFHTKNDSGQRAIRAAYYSGETGRIEIAFPDGTTAAFDAFVRSYTLSAAEVDGAVGFRAVLRPVGTVTVTEGGEDA